MVETSSNWGGTCSSSPVWWSSGAGCGYRLDAARRSDAPGQLGGGDGRTQRREFGRQPGRLDLVQLHRLREAAEAPRAEALQADTLGKRVEHRRPHRRREDDLAAVRREADASCRVDRQADVAGVGQRRTPAVQPYSQTHLDAVWPRP